MENAQKAIMIGVGLFITIIIIAAVMLITGMGQNLLNQGQSQVSGISESLMNDMTQQYNGKILSGAQVRTAAVQLVNRGDSAIVVQIDGDAVTSTTAVNSAITSTSQKYTGNVSYEESTGVVTVNFEPNS